MDAKTRNRNAAKKRVDAGICLRCELPSFDGKTMCQAHQAAHNAYLTNRRNKRKAAGICRMCPQPIGKSSLYLCDDCFVRDNPDKAVVMLCTVCGAIGHVGADHLKTRWLLK